ncbi:hypothetical protein scyTo_0016668, partial [Scyliorhinus torazame]|nr:hypothetical protein [Scyliorhinus torazame]
SEWDIVLCKYCGSSGTHLACSLLESYMEDWECPECRDIVYKSEKLRKRRLEEDIKSPKRKFSDNQELLHSPSKCPRLSSETRKECRKCQIFTTRPLPDILKDLRSQIKLNVISRINVDRTNVWEGALREMRRKMFRPTSTLCVTFSDDARKPQVAVDLGNPCREFLCLLMHHLANSVLFEGSATSKNMTLNSRALRCDWYYEAGRMIAVSIVHGGPSPNFFSTTLFHCLAYGPEVTEPTMEDVTHFEMAQKIKKVAEARVRRIKWQDSQ